jgi:hypothetical protein
LRPDEKNVSTSWKAVLSTALTNSDDLSTPIRLAVIARLDRPGLAGCSQFAPTEVCFTDPGPANRQLLRAGK